MNHEEMIAEIQKLKLRVEALEQAPAKKSPGGSPEKRFKKLNEIDLMIKSALEDGKHILVREVDLIYSDQLFQILEALYGEKTPYFRYTSLSTSYFGKSKEQTSRCRSLGMRLNKLGYKTLRSRYYNKPEDGGWGNTVNRTVWVLRNFNNYKDYSDTEIGVLADEQWKKAMTAYNIALEKEDKVKQTQEPSFL